MNQQLQYATKKYLFDLLQDKYQNNENIIERISYHLATEKDAKEFLQMVADSWEKGYIKALNECRDKFQELGHEIEVKY